MDWRFFYEQNSFRAYVRRRSGSSHRHGGLYDEQPRQPHKRKKNAPQRRKNRESGRQHCQRDFEHYALIEFVNGKPIAGKKIIYKSIRFRKLHFRNGLHYACFRF